MSLHHSYFSFFFNDPATTEIYTLSLHDALPICRSAHSPTSIPRCVRWLARTRENISSFDNWRVQRTRSEEHTSELQSRRDLVCRLLLEKKKKKKNRNKTE